MKGRKYLYGIIDSKNSETFGRIGVGNSEVYTIQHRDVGAVVSDIPSGFKIEIEEARTHEKVLVKIMETHTIIPVAFGVVVKDEAEIRELLKHARMRFKSTLRKIKNKLQINVTVSLEKNVLAEILRENEKIRALAAQAKRDDADQNLKIELGSRVKATLDERRNQYTKDIRTFLGAYSDKFREHRIVDQYTVMNDSFLVDRRREKDFYERLDEVEKKYDGKLAVLAVTPLPPYDHTRIEIRKMDFHDIEEARKKLGLDQEVSLSETTSAYEQLARKYHPDLHPNNPSAGKRFREIKDAYELLTKYCEHCLFSLERSRVERTPLIQEKTG